MKRFNFYILIISSLITFFVGIIIGMKYLSEKCEKQEEVNVSVETVIERVYNKSFLVTKSVLFDQEAEKTTDRSWWSNLWLKDDIKAKAKVNVDLGVNLENIKEDNVIVNHDLKKISIKLPKTEVYRTSLEGDVMVETNSGLISVFTRDKDKDYNDAIDQLKKTAEEVVVQKDDYIKSAEENAKNIIKILLNDLDYQVDFVE